MEDGNAQMAVMQAQFEETIAKLREDLTARLRVQEAANKKMGEEREEAAKKEATTMGTGAAARQGPGGKGLQQQGPHYSGPASGIWCERCGRAGHEAKICAAREPRRFNGLCYDLPMSPTYSGRSGGTDYDIPWYPPQYSSSNNGYGTNEGPQQQYGRGADGSAGYAPTFAQQQKAGYDIPFSPPQYNGSNNGYGTNEDPQQKYGRGADGSAWHGTTLSQQQATPRPFRSFGWDQRYACRNGPPVNGGLSNCIEQGQAQRDVGVDDREDIQRPLTEVDYHGGSLSEIFGSPESEEQQRTFTEVDFHGGPLSDVFGSPESEEQQRTLTEVDYYGGRLSEMFGSPESEEQQRTLTEVDYHGRPLSEVFGSPESEEQRRTSMKIDCHDGPASEVSGFLEVTASYTRGGLPLQARHLRRLQPSSGTLSLPTAVIPNSAFEEWLQSDNVEMPMFSLSEEPQQSAPTAVALAAAAVEEGCGGSAHVVSGAASAAVPSSAPATGGTLFPTALVGGAARAPASVDGTVALTAVSATDGTVPSAASVGEAPASSAVAAASVEPAAEPAISCTISSAASVGGQSGDANRPLERCHRTRQRRRHRRKAALLPLLSRVAWLSRKLASAAGSAGDKWIANICGERGALTHPFDPGTVFPLEVRYSSDEHGNSSRRSSNNDNTYDCDSWWDATCDGTLLRPFDSGKRCRRRMRRGKAGFGVDPPFDRGKEWWRMQHGG